MDITTVSQVIANLGFPIAVCIALFWKMNKQDEQHKEEMDKMTEALNSNTQALIKLSDKLEGITHGE